MSNYYRLDTRNWDHKFRASVYQANQAGSELCIEAGKEARNLGIWAMQPIHVSSELQR